MCIVDSGFGLYFLLIVLLPSSIALLVLVLLVVLLLWCDVLTVMIACWF